MRLHKQAPETSLGAEVYHQTSLVIDTHAGRIQRTWQKYTQTDRILQKNFFFYNLMWISLSTETQSVIFWPSKELTLQFGLRGAADAVLPENGSVVHESEPQLWLQVEVLPATGSHGRVEHVRHVQRHAQGHVGLDQVKHLQGRFEMF